MKNSHQTRQLKLLSLNRTTMRRLMHEHLAAVVGASTNNTCSQSQQENIACEPQ